MNINCGNLKRIQAQFPETDFWTDSLSLSNIRFGLENGCKGVTTAPTITKYTLEEEFSSAESDIKALRKLFPTVTDRELLWEWTYKAVRERAKTQLPLFGSTNQKTDGLFAVQLNIYDHSNADKMLEQAKKISELGTNIIIKIPVTSSGLKVIEEAVFNGINVMSTGTCSVAQTIMAAEAQKRGIDRRTALGLKSDDIRIMCAMQIGPQDICIKEYADKNGISLSDAELNAGGIAVAKRAYKLLKERGFKSRFLLSYFMTDAHWLEFLGGDIVLTMTRTWLDKVNAYEREVENRIDREVPEEIVNSLLDKIPHFRKAYLDDGMTPEEFDTFIPASRTLGYFADVYDQAVKKVRGVILPDKF